MQQTYADAIRDIAQFDTQRDGSFSGWLTSLARCNLRDAIRMLKAQKRGGDRTRIELPQDGSSHVVLVEQLAGPGASPSSHAGQDEIQTALERALRQLPPSYQKAVEMYDLEGEPVARIAQALGRSPGAVYMLRARALDWLREIMGSSTKFFTDFS